MLIDARASRCSSFIVYCDVSGVVGLKLEYDSPDTTSLQTCWYRYYLLWSLSS